jgi:hypothetical protein
VFESKFDTPAGGSALRATRTEPVTPHRKFGEELEINLQGGIEGWLKRPVLYVP